MRKLREVATLLSDTEALGITRVKREEREPMPYEKSRLICGCIVRLSAIVALTVLVLFAEIWNLALAFGVLFFLLLFRED